METAWPRAAIRLAQPGDESAIASVLYSAFLEYRPLYTEAGFAATTPPSGEIRRRFDEGPAWVALLDDRIVGTVAAVPKQDGLYVRSMAVLPAASGKGIGRALLREVVKFASARGSTRLFLSTTPFLNRAIRLYEESGFERNDIGPTDLFGTPLFTMSKSLDPTIVERLE